MVLTYARCSLLDAYTASRLCQNCNLSYMIFQVEISRCDEILSENLSLKEISRIYGLHGKVGFHDNDFQNYFVRF